MPTLRYIMVGGFLGAGKTTTLARLARHYLDRGRKVGIVTNDQAQGLVDTATFKRQGFPVEEVAGACFCCRFDDLMQRIESLDATERPDLILAEPVGSCTDLVATVIRPLHDLYQGRFSIAPYSVIFKPSHGLRILGGEGRGFSEKAAYIFRKQLEEADLVLLNRIDELAPSDKEKVIDLIRKHYPRTPVLPISAKTGEGFDALTAMLEQEGDFGRRVLDIDYDVYAAGEAELGWFNGSLRVAATEEFSLDEFLLDVVDRLRGELAAADAETAHLKAIGLWEGFFGVANLVSRDSRPELSLPSHCNVSEADVIVNARVATDPVLLEQLVRRVISDWAESKQATAEWREVQRFRPGRPVPTHRFGSPTE